MVKIGERYGKLVVIEMLGLDKTGHRVVKCKCDCGNVKDIRSSSLQNGKTMSCDCGRYNKERFDKLHESRKHYHNVYGEKMSQTEMAKYFGVSPMTVTRAMNKYGENEGILYLESRREKWNTKH